MRDYGVYLMEVIRNVKVEIMSSARVTVSYVNARNLLSVLSQLSSCQVTSFCTQVIINFSRI